MRWWYVKCEWHDYAHMSSHQSLIIILNPKTSFLPSLPTLIIFLHKWNLSKASHHPRIFVNHLNMFQLFLKKKLLINYDRGWVQMLEAWGGSMRLWKGEQNGWEGGKRRSCSSTLKYIDYKGIPKQKIRLISHCLRTRQSWYLYCLLA